MIRRTPVDTKINHERWLVSYADFITLLFAFFVVMYSVSQVSESKYRTLSETLQSAFGSAAESKPTAAAAAQPSLVSPQTLENTLRDSLSGLLASGEIRLWGNEDWVEISVDAQLLFTSGSAEPSPQARQIFARLAGVLAPFENAVAVSGHTDSVPIDNNRFSSNWALSAARAVAVVNLLAYDGIDPERLSATGYGEFQPVADNSTAQGRAKNRRVVLRVSRQRMQLESAPVEAITGLSSDPATAEATIPDGASAPEVISPAEPPAGEEATAENYRQNAPIQPRKLKNGGLLFTTDDNTPRPVED